MLASAEIETYNNQHKLGKKLESKEVLVDLSKFKQYSYKDVDELEKDIRIFLKKEYPEYEPFVIDANNHKRINDNKLRATLRRWI